MKRLRDGSAVWAVYGAYAYLVPHADIWKVCQIIIKQCILSEEEKYIQRKMWIML